MKREPVPDTADELISIFARTPLFVREMERRCYGRTVHGVFVADELSIPDEVYRIWADLTRGDPR